MSAELRDLRAKVTVEADCALEAEARATGKEKSEIVRELIQTWAVRRIHAANFLQRSLKNEGIEGIPVASRDGDA